MMLFIIIGKQILSRLNDDLHEMHPVIAYDNFRYDCKCLITCIFVNVNPLLRKRTVRSRVAVSAGHL